MFRDRSCGRLSALVRQHLHGVGSNSYTLSAGHAAKQCRNLMKSSPVVYRVPNTHQMV